MTSKDGHPENDIRLGGGFGKWARIQHPPHDLAHVMLSDEARMHIADLLTEQRYAGALDAHHLRPRSRLLLIGPSSAWRMALAGAIARALGLPFLVVDYDSLITSYAGEAGAKIGVLLNRLAGQPCVLLLNEAETILPGPPSGASDIIPLTVLAIGNMGVRTILVGSTNRPYMLDPAIRQSFDLEIKMPIVAGA